MSKAIEELADMGLRIFESENPDRLEVDFTIEDGKDNVAWVWGTLDDYEVECDHAIVEYDDDETVGECLVCGATCDWHWEGDGEWRGQVPHSWERGDGGIIKKYINAIKEMKGIKC